MKNLFAMIILVMVTLSVNAQKAEVLYFKANLPCCPARACNAVESEIQNIIKENFDSEKVAFKQVLIAEASNKSLVEKHNAKSQTVVISLTKKGKETNVDVSDIIRSFNRDSDKEKLKKDLVAKINETLK
jgi:hypothetical protein